MCSSWKETYQVLCISDEPNYVTPNAKKWKNLKSECIQITEKNNIKGFRFKTEQLT
jgi:hypothetical protein